MATTRYGDAEDEALQYLPHRAQIIYLRGLRRWMDYESGIVGRGREISIQMLVELLEVGGEFTANNRTASVTPREVRVSLGQLERAGLIERLEGRRVSNLVHTLVFKLVLAEVDSSVKNSQVTVRSQSGHTRQGTGDLSGGAACGGSQVTVRSQSGHTSEVTPPVSGIRSNHLTAVVDVESIGADRDECPGCSAGWFEFFNQRCGVTFLHRKLHTAKNGRLFESWVERGVSVGDVMDAMVIAHGQLEGVLPDSPAYYGWAVDSVLQGKNTGGGNGKGRAGVKRQSGASVLAEGCANAFR